MEACYGVVLEDHWEMKIDRFRIEYMNLGLEMTPKFVSRNIIWVIFRNMPYQKYFLGAFVHVKEWITHNQSPLGVLNESAFESVHR